MNDLFIVAFLLTLLVPTIMIIFGSIFSKNSPKNINRIYGYRTPRSMKNQETWEFANKYCGKLWLRIGIIMLIITSMLLVIAMTFGESIVLVCTSIFVTIQTVTIILSVLPVEMALKKEFDDEGKRI